MDEMKGSFQSTELLWCLKLSVGEMGVQQTDHPNTLPSVLHEICIVLEDPTLSPIRERSRSSLRSWIENYDRRI